MRHPLHPALVHFPVACWSLATLADVYGLISDDRAWTLAGMLIATGALMAVPAMLAGLVDLARIPGDGPAMRTAYYHMGAMMLALLCYAASLLLRLDQMRLVSPDTIALALSVAGFAVLLAGGWLGARLVYHHGVGVRASTTDRQGGDNSRT